MKLAVLGLLTAAPFGMAQFDGLLPNVAGHAVGEAAWPPGTVLVSIQRGNELLFADREAILREGDLVSLLARPDEAEGVRLALAGDAEEPGPRPHGPEFV